MRATDITVEVRDNTLDRVGVILPKDLVMEAKLRWCGVGEWKLTLPGDHAMVPYLSEPGSGLLVTWRNPQAPETRVLFSGPTTVPSKARTTQNPDGTYTFTGLTDEVHLQDGLAYPDPLGSADPNAQTKSNDERTTNTESLLRQYVAYNVAYDTALSGRIAGFRQYLDLKGVSANRGITQTKSPRFQNLLELLQEIVVGNNNELGFKVVQEDEWLMFQIVERADLREVIRFDVASGTLASEQVSKQGPGLTRPIVAGQGEGTERQMVTATTPGTVVDEAAWGRVIEQFFDRRDTNDPTELTQKALEELIAASGGTAAKVIPADDTTMRYLLDWNVGDWVTVLVEGQELESIITEAVLLFGKDSTAIGAALGDVTSYDPRDVVAKKQNTLDQRISHLERVNQGVPAGTMSQYLGATAPEGYLLCQGQSLLRADYPALFAIIGTTYGSVDSTHFNLPDLRGRVAVGRDSGQTEFDTLGEKSGAKTHTLTFAEVPDEDGLRMTWGQGNIGFSTQPQAYAGAPTGNGLGTWQNDPKWDAGGRPSGGGAHNNLQPYIVVNYIVKT